MRTNDDTELPEVHRPSFETALTFAEQEVEDFLEPLVYVWDEERYIVSEAIRRYLALQCRSLSRMHLANPSNYSLRLK